VAGPPAGGAGSEGLVEGVAGALERAAAEDAVRAILLRGEGRAFCAGDDLKEFEGQVRSNAGTHRYLTRIQDTARMMVLGRKPVVAAAQGWAAGGGLEWLINADFVIIAEGTRCFFPEVSLGFIVTGGITRSYAEGLPRRLFVEPVEVDGCAEKTCSLASQT
jgi:enoyl-CoA hydratase/carnithine racemase